MGAELSFFAYRLPHAARVELTPAGRMRDWMAGNSSKHCLPMLIANQWGWVMLNPVPFRATWDGGSDATAVDIEFLTDTPPHPIPVESHFGDGILTWWASHLFRTPPGYNLYVRGPANSPKDGICPLEGVVETDWSVATFTMNWKLTRPGHPVTFAAGEPFCMVSPERRGELEEFRPEVRALASDPEAETGYEEWHQSRHEQQVMKFAARHVPGLDAVKPRWEKHYYRGRTPGGAEAHEHQTRLELAEFAEPSADEV